MGEKGVMAVLKDLIVHGRSRFVNGIDADSIHANLIDANDGVFKTITTTTLDAETITTDMLTAQNARVAQTLTVDGTISTNKWEAANIANIGGNFYLSPTGKADSGNITVTKTGSTTINGVSVGVYTLVVGGTSFGVTSTSSTIWGAQSKVIFTGSIAYNSSKKYPLGTCNGTMTSVSTGSGTLTGFTITGVNSPALDIFFKEQGVTSVSSTACTGYEMQISVYQSYYSSALHPIGILLTSYGKEQKQYIDIYGGANTLGDSASGFANPSVRIGQLDGLPNIVDNSTDSATAPSGWGIYTDNGFFKGKIVSNAGRIAGWTIGTSAIYNNTNSKTSTTAGTYLGTDAIRNYNSSTQYVHIENGKITAKNVDLSGTITATAGTIGGATISNGVLQIANANIISLSADKITSGDIAAARIQTNLITAINAKVSDISALTATLGGFQVDSTSIHTNGVAVTSNADNSIGISSADFTRTINGTSRAGLRLAIGDKFGITGDGILYASGATIQGDVTVSKLTVSSGATISDTDGLINNDIVREEASQEIQDTYTSLSDNLDELQANLATTIDDLQELNTYSETEIERITQNVNEYLGANGYMLIEDQGLKITKGNFAVIITGTDILFQEDGTTVAWISGQKLYINRTEVTQSMKVGNFEWMIRTDGRLTLAYIGGN